MCIFLKDGAVAKLASLLLYITLGLMGVRVLVPFPILVYIVYNSQIDFFVKCGGCEASPV